MTTIPHDGSDLEQLVGETRQRLRRNAVMTGATLVVAAAVGWLVLSAVVDLLVPLPVALRVVLGGAFWLILAFGVFMLIDVVSGMVFNFPIFFGTIAPGPDRQAAFAAKLIDDPVLVTMLQISLWITYPIARLAWFFCYLDQRIRNECWDLELQFRVEAARLGEQPA